MKQARPTRRLRSTLIALNLVFATAMLISLVLGLPVTLIAVPMAVVFAASAIAVFSGR